MLEKQLIKYANQDLKTARDRGHMAIAQTKRGTIEVYYSEGVYKLFDSTGGLLAQGKAQTARDFIVANYQIVQD